MKKMRGQEVREKEKERKGKETENERREMDTAVKEPNHLENTSICLSPFSSSLLSLLVK